MGKASATDYELKRRKRHERLAEKAFLRDLKREERRANKRLRAAEKTGLTAVSETGAQ
jgi:hypothetical protein